MISLAVLLFLEFSVILRTQTIKYETMSATYVRKGNRDLWVWRQNSNILADKSAVSMIPFNSFL